MGGRGTWCLRVCCRSAEGKIPTDEHILALLSEEDFFAFETTGNLLEAYTHEETVALKGKVLLEEQWGPAVQPEISFIPEHNWNEAWERTYQPVLLCEEALYVRAPHHPPAQKEILDVIIKPGMGFGTGHHPTTALVACAMMKENLVGKAVMDVGCGSGILSILARKRGAISVVAVDNDATALENARGNMGLNGIISDGIRILSDIRDVLGCFDIIAANINRNTLLTLADSITGHSKEGTRLYMSGFFLEDKGVLEKTYENVGWVKTRISCSENWAIMVLEKRG